MATDYPASVEQVYAALGDERYWRARLAGSGADEARLERLEVSGDGIDVATVQVLRSGRLPALVSQFHRGDLAITREETWTPLADGHAGAQVTGGIPGAPVSLTGTGDLSSVERKARMAFQALVEVEVPLVAAKLENFIGTQLTQLLLVEQRFTSAWIAGHP